MKIVKIQSDSHGLYFRVGGWLFRPYQPTKFTVGEQVRAKHIAQTDKGKIEKLDKSHNELWINHGMYWKFENGKEKIIDSEELYRAIVQYSVNLIEVDWG